MRLPGSRAALTLPWPASGRTTITSLFSRTIKTAPSCCGWPPTTACCMRSIPTPVPRFLPMCQAPWPTGWRRYRCSGAATLPGARNWLGKNFVTLANRLAEIPLQRGSNAAGRTKLPGKDLVTGAENLPPHGTVWPYVDGNPFSADVKVGIAAGTAWKTYVFGTLGRGGKGVFALDATRIADLTEDNAANVFKWQFTAADDPDLGYITGEVSIHATSNQALPVAKMNNGKYALLLGNGYKSESGKAVLYVLFVNGPNAPDWTPGRDGSYLKIVADAGPGNGLSMNRWADIDAHGTADVAYAGDLKGNIWKFNLQHRTNPAMWQVDPQDGSASLGPGNASSVGRSWPLPNAGRPNTTGPQVAHIGP